MTGNYSDMGRVRLWSRNQRTILTQTPLRVGIGIVVGSCWWNLSQNRLRLNWNCDEWNSELSWCTNPIPHSYVALRLIEA